MEQIEKKRSKLKKFFSQTAPVDGMNWFNSKLFYSIGLLEKLKFSQTDSNDEMNWSTPKLA